MLQLWYDFFNPPKVYKTVNWTEGAGEILVIHRLAVHPKFQGQSIAGKLMDFAEGHALNHNYAAIRLDAFFLFIRLYIIRFYRVSMISLLCPTTSKKYVPSGK